MDSSMQRFAKLLANMHYSAAFIQYLAQSLDGIQNVNTIQQYFEVLTKQANTIINYLKEHPTDHKYIEYKNILCLESIRQYFDRLRRGVTKTHGSDVKKFKEALKLKCNEMIHLLNESTGKVSTNAQMLWEEPINRTVMTFSYSKSVVQALKKASLALNGMLKVYVCQSGPMCQGQKTFKDLSLEKINCQLISDNQIGYYLTKVDCVIVGCQVVLETGAILNRAGTYMLAMCAYQQRKPVYVLTESYKFLRKTILTQNDIPQSLQICPVSRDQKSTKQSHYMVLSDLTDSKYIRLFITDIGIFTPQGVAAQLSKVFY